MEFIHYSVTDETTYTKEYILDDLADVRHDIPYGDTSISQVLDLYLPAQGSAPYPTLIYIHGGGLMRGDKTRHINPLLQGLRYGYALACVNYRLASEAPFPAMIYDVTSAIRFLKVNATTYGLNPEKFILWGETHGSYLACLAGIYGETGEYNDPTCPYVDQNARVAGIIDYWAITDFLTTYEASLKKRESDPDAMVLEELIFGSRGEDLVNKISAYPLPLNGIRPGLPAFYILHGELDTEIPLEHSYRYYEALKAAGNDVTMEIVPNTKHSLPMYTEAWQIEGTYRFIHRIFQ